MSVDLKSLLSVAIQAAEAACKEILEVYNSGDFQAEAKGDQSPLTLADKKAHTIICQILSVSELPILSEEGREIPYDERRHWEYFWMVDPLDGTKEFIKRNGEFTVNIALIHRQKPVVGVVAVPVNGEVYYAVAGEGAFIKKDNKDEALMRREPKPLHSPGLRIVASRSHMNEETESFINACKSPVLVSAGSSLKFLLLATGKADAYPRYAPTMEWDTAAAHIIANESGFKVINIAQNEELIYNKADLLNPYFLVH
jgi:3'(2'), 5'-bisphosphate nucleotidase